MADDTGKKPEGPLGQDFWDRACFPGRLLTFVITDCTDGAPILQFSAADAQGGYHASNNGSNIVSFCTLPGYQFTLSAGRYASMTVSVTQKMFDDRQVVLCLTPLPKLPDGINPEPWPRCFVSAAVGLDPRSGDAFLDMARAFRSIMRTGSRGGDIVAAYEADESQELFRKLADDPTIMLRVLSIALRVMPLVARVVTRAADESTGLRRLPKDERLDPVLAKDMQTLLQDAERLAGSWKLLPLVSAAVTLAERKGIMASIVDEDRAD